METQGTTGTSTGTVPVKRTLRDLHGKNIVVFDCEIKNVIDGKDVTWSTHDKMGVSVVCLFDYLTLDNYVYFDNNLDELVARLEKADLITGYNIDGFDLPLLKACAPGFDHTKINWKSYDMLHHVRMSVSGWNPQKEWRPKGCRLNDVLSATFGMKKTEDGADAPLMWQRQEIGRLVTYCLADVRRERMAFEFAYLNGYLKTPINGTHPMKNPLEVLAENTVKF